MRDLMLHIEHLLPEHDCIVVPGLGGFVQNEIASKLNHEKETFCPRGKEIIFNAKLTFNDGILVQSYQEYFNISFEEATKRILGEVREIQDLLDNNKLVNLGRIGTLLKNDQGQLQFRPDNRNLYYPESYGLSTFTYPTLLHRRKMIQEDKKRQPKSEFIHIRFRRESFHNFVAVTLVCLLMLMISKPAGYLDDKSYQQAFLLKNYIAVSDDQMDITESSRSNEVTKEIPVTNIPEVTIPSEPTAQATMPATEKKESPKAENVSKPKRIYHIVVSSFQGKESAEYWLSENRSGIFRQADIIEGSGRARISIRTFTNKTEAESFLDNFRKNNPKHSDAWLLSTKN